MASGLRSFVALEQAAGGARWRRSGSPLAVFVRLASVAAFGLAVAVGPTARVPAAEYFWDPDGAASSTVGGSGTWDLTSSLWRIGSVTGSLTTWPNLDVDTAAFAAIGVPATVTIADAVTVTAGSLRIGDGYLITRAGTGSLTLGGALGGAINVSSGTVEIAAPISGAVGVTKTGSGTTLVLSGASDYTGLTTVSGGTLRVTNGSALGAAGAGNGVTVASGQLELFGGVTVTGKTITINNQGNNQGALQSLSGDNTWAGDVVIGNSAARVGAAEGSILRLTGGISGGNPFIVRSYDTGGLSTAIVEVSGASSYTGATQVFAGTLRLAGSDNRLPIGTTVTLGVNTASGVLDLGGVNQTVASIGTSGTGTQNRIGNSSTTADSTLTVAAGTSTVTYGGGIVDTIGSGTRKTGISVTSGTLSLAGAYAYTGGTTVAPGASLTLGRTGSYAFDSLISGGGAVTFSGGAPILSQASTFSGGATIASGTGTVRLAASSVASGGTVLSGPVGTGTLTLNGGFLTAADAATPRTLHNPITIGGNFNLGSSAAEFAAPMTLAGPVTLTGTRTITVAADSTISSAIGDAGGGHGLTKSGTATLTLSGQSTYGGTTTVSAGRLLLAGGNNRLPTGAALVVSGGTLDLGTTGQTTTGSLTVSSGSLAGNSLSAGGITVSGGTVSVAALTNTAPSAIAISSGGTIPSILASTSASGLTKTGDNTLTLTGVNTYSGPTTVSAGSLVVTNASALGAAGVGNGVSVANNASVWLADGVTVSGKAISLIGRGGTDSSGALRSASGTATWAGDIALPTDVTEPPRVGAGSVTNPVSTLVVSGIVSGSNATHGFAIRPYTTGAQTVGQNGGTVVLSGANTYAGPTTVVTGALMLAGGGNRLPTTTILAIGNSSNVSWASADLGGTNQTLGGLRSVGTSTLMPMLLTNSSATASLVTIGQNVDEGHVYDGVISGNLAVTKTGSNRLSFGGANTYTGTTTLNAGILRFGPSVGTVGAITSSGIGIGPLVLNGGTLSSSSGTARTILNPTTLGGNVDLGGVSPNNGLLDFAAATTLTGTRTLTLANDVTFSGAIAESGGSFGLTKAGTGLLTLTGTNTYTGTTTVSAGTVTIGDGSTTGFVAGPISVATGSTIRFATAAATPQTHAGAIAGDGLLEKTAAGTLTLSGTNTYTGGTSITGGAIIFNTAAAIGGTGANVTVGTGATAALVTGDFNTFLGRINTTSTGTIALAADSSSPINLGSLPSAASLGAVGTVTYSGTLTPAAGAYRLGGLSGTLVLDQTGQITGANVFETTGNVTLAATMNHTGGTFVRAGTLALAGGNDRLPTTGAITVSGGTLALGSTSQTVPGITLGGVAGATARVDVGTGSLRLGGNVTYSATNNPPAATIAGSGGTLALLGNRTFTVGLTSASTARSLTVSAIIADGDATARSITKDGLGAMVLEGNNTFTGGVTVTNGTLIVDGTNAYTGSTSIAATNGAALRVRNALALGTTAGNTVVNSNGRLELAGGVTVTGESLSLSGTGGNSFGALQSQAGDNTWAGPVNLTAAGSRVGGLLGTTLRISGVISGTGQLVIRPEGTTTSTAIIEFSGANTYSGGTAVYAGTLRLAGGDDRLPTGGALTMGLSSNALYGNFDLGGFNQTVAGLTAVGNSIPLHVIATSSTTADSTLTVNLASGSNAYGGQLRDSINGGTRKLGLTKSGAGTLVISGGSNTFSGATRLDGGMLEVGNALALQNSTVDTRSGSAGSLSFGTQTAAAFGGLTGSNALSLQNSSSAAVALTVGGNGESTTFGGTLSGAGSLTKAGAGTLTLTGANTYAGATAINAGTLVAGHSSAFGTTGSVTIGNGAVLGIGTGVTFTRPLSIPGTGRVSAGDNASVILPDVAALVAWESRSPGVSGTLADILSGSGPVGSRTLASSWTANPGAYLSDILSLDGTGVGTTYVLSMTYSGSPDPASLNVWYRETTGDSFAPLGTSFQGVGAWTSGFSTVGQYGVDTTAGSVWVVTDHNSQFVVVPEPSTMLLAILAVASLAGLTQRRHALRRKGWPS